MEDGIGHVVDGSMRITGFSVVTERLDVDALLGDKRDQPCVEVPAAPPVDRRAPARSVRADGEIVIYNQNGQVDFGRLQGSSP